MKIMKLCGSFSASWVVGKGRSISSEISDHEGCQASQLEKMHLMRWVVRKSAPETFARGRDVGHEGEGREIASVFGIGFEKIRVDWWGIWRGQPSLGEVLRN